MRYARTIWAVSVLVIGGLLVGSAMAQDREPQVKPGDRVAVLFMCRSADDAVTTAQLLVDTGRDRDAYVKRMLSQELECFDGRMGQLYSRGVLVPHWEARAVRFVSFVGGQEDLSYFEVWEVRIQDGSLIYTWVYMVTGDIRV